MQSNAKGEKIDFAQKFRDGLTMSRSALLTVPRINEIAISRLILILVLSLGAFLRLWQLNKIGFNTDEAVYSGQAAAIVQDPALKEIFPVFRAHPLLFHFVLALVFQFGVNDLRARLAAVTLGIATIYLVYQLGKLLYGRPAGLLAALFIALMPYHILVSRQVLLDGPMVFFSTLTLYLLARFAMTQRPAWLYVTGIGMGLTFLSKETGIILIGSIYAFLALAREIRIRIIDIVFSAIFMALMMAPFPLSLWLGGGAKSGQSYLIWQLFRRPNHTWDFYLTSVPPAIGYLVIAIALLGFWFLRHEKSWRENLLVWWIIVPVAFFQMWPTKGFQYLLPIAPAIAVLAGRTLARWLPVVAIDFKNRNLIITWVKILATGIIAISLLIPTWQLIQPSTSGTFIAGTGGVPGGREAGIWIQENIPMGAKMVTIGPSMANILEFYGHRHAYGLSVSPNPLRRNPSYQPVINPDLQIRNGDIQFLVWDSFSAQRSDFFSETLLKLVKRFNGRSVYVGSVAVLSKDGTSVEKPVIIIYEVRP
jgi:hypothetical protein